MSLLAKIGFNTLSYAYPGLGHRKCVGGGEGYVILLSSLHIIYLIYFINNSILFYSILFYFIRDRYFRGVNLYGLRVSLTDFCDLHGLTGVRCNPYGYLWFLQIQTYNHSTLYIRTVVSLQWHQLCFVNTKVNDLWHKLFFVCLLYMGVTAGSYSEIVFCNGVDNL